MLLEAVKINDRNRVFGQIFDERGHFRQLVLPTPIGDFNENYQHPVMTRTNKYQSFKFVCLFICVFLYVFTVYGRFFEVRKYKY